MFDRKTYSQMRRAGFGLGVSKEKLKQAMVEILLQLPEGTSNLKETVIYHLGQYGQMTPVRDLNTQILKNSYLMVEMHFIGMMVRSKYSTKRFLRQILKN